MKTNYFLLAIFFSFYTYAQVGINTTLPKAQLEIKSSNQASPANTDGIIIPKINTFPVTNPTAAQQSMMVYLTTTSAGKLPGFYYWDNTTVNWISVAGSKGWDLNGNSGTTSSNFIGTTDAQNLVFRTNNIDHLRITQKGQIEHLNTGNSVFIGEQAGLNDDLTTNNNVFVGYQSGKINTTGNSNCAFGYQSLFSNTSGNLNVALGFQPLFSNTFGTQNIAIGNQALFSNIYGSNNIAIGDSSLFSNTSGDNSLAIGYHSLFSNTSGFGNLAIGGYSLISNTTGGSNIAVGLLSMLSNTTGNTNTALGTESLNSNTTGSHNMAMGHQALRQNITGNINIAIGEGALKQNTSGENNTSIGYNANNSNSIGSYNTAIGKETMYFNTSGNTNVALGSLSLYHNTTGNENVAIGASALENNSFGSQNVAIGNRAALHSTGDYNISIGSGAADNVGSTLVYSGSNNIYVGYFSTVTNPTLSYQMSIANVIYGSTMSTTALGKIGIGQPNPTEKLDIAGNLKVSGAIMPNNLAGTTGQVLTSAGAGTAPIWSSSSIQKYITTGVLTGVFSIPLTEYTVRVFNSVSGIQLPTAVGNQGKIFVIIGSNGIASKTLSTLGGTIYDDVTNTSLTTITTNQRFTVQSDGTDWIVIGR